MVIQVFYSGSSEGANSLSTLLDQELAGRYARDATWTFHRVGHALVRRCLSPFAPWRPRRSRALLVAEIDECSVGCLVLFTDSRDSLELGRMYVAPEYRGSGVADALLERAEEVAGALGSSRIRLETGKRQPEAVAVYERHGYTRTRRWGRYRGSLASQCFAKRLRVDETPA